MSEMLSIAGNSDREWPYLCHMLHRFPPPPDKADTSFIASKTETFAKLKTESLPNQRTVLMTGHTLIFVLEGVKLLHFPDMTVRASPGEVILLRKGIYVMAEYVEDGLDFEAVMLFLPGKLLRSMVAHSGPRENGHSGARRNDSFVVFPSTEVIDSFKKGFRGYFGASLRGLDELLPLKQREILLLLLEGPQGDRVRSFIRDAVGDEPADIDYVVSSYLLQPVTIEELANLANCSLAKFKRDFRERYQCSPRAWINQQRLAHARMLLQNTDTPIAGVARECGFDNAAHFIQLFRKAYGVTPTAARAEIDTM